LKPSPASLRTPLRSWKLLVYTDRHWLSFRVGRKAQA
jgi:hypothetical protein